MPDFGDSERDLLHVFRNGAKFSFEGRQYIVEFAGKPTCGLGEPKTDVFVRCKVVSGSGRKDFKISYKQCNADFLENKISAERAEEIFGSNWASIISGATTSLRELFEKRPLVYKESVGRTDKGAITLGWKFEFVNCSSGDLTGTVALTDDQKCDIFAGTNLSHDKRDAYVCGRLIADSGIADHIIVSDNVDSVQSAVNMMQKISDYARNVDVCFACKALNYRTLHNPPKWDGNRPLAVQVDWFVENGKLTSRLDFAHPLVRKGNEVGNMLKAAMRRLGVTSTEDLSASNCTCL